MKKVFLLTRPKPAPKKAAKKAAPKKAAPKKAAAAKRGKPTPQGK